MKLAISSSGKDLAAKLDPRFGRCRYFLIIETDDMSFEVFDNENAALGGGAGIQSAQLIAAKGAKALITGHCGPNAMQTLSAARVQVYLGQVGTVQGLVDKYKNGQLTPTTEANASAHAGTGGKGMGPGQGMGRGRGMGGRGMGGRGTGGAGARQSVTIKTGKTVEDECDAGLMKFAVPIFVENEFLGVAGGCGLLRNQEQVDIYLVHRTTGLAEEVVEGLSENIETIPNDRLESAISYLEKKVAEIIREFRSDPQGLI